MNNIRFFFCGAGVWSQIFMLTMNFAAESHTFIFIYIFDAQKSLSLSFKKNFQHLSMSQDL